MPLKYHHQRYKRKKIEKNQRQYKIDTTTNLSECSSMTKLLINHKLFLHNDRHIPTKKYSNCSSLCISWLQKQKEKEKKQNCEYTLKHMGFITFFNYSILHHFHIFLLFDSFHLNSVSTISSF